MAKALRLSIALAAMLIATPAMALTVNINVVDNDHYFGGTAGGPGPSTFVPEGPDPASPVLTNVNLGGTILYINPPPGSSPSNYRSPWQYLKSGANVDYEPIAKYTSVQAGSSGEIFYGIGSNKTGLALAWGSPDSYNEIRFFLGGLEVASLTGSDVGGQAFGLNLVVLTLMSGFYDTVRFYSIGSNAFEFSNVRAFPNSSEPVVPLPAGLILLLSGLTGLGFLGRARAKAA